MAMKFDDVATWTAVQVCMRLKSGKISGDFYKTVFAWSDADLEEAIRRTQRALKAAGIDPNETLVPIRLDKATGNPTAGAMKRLNAESDLTSKQYNFDGLFSMPHEKGRKKKPPRWFMERMLPAGRERIDQYDFPTITQKFIQFAREKLRLTPEDLEEAAEVADEDKEMTSAEAHLPHAHNDQSPPDPSPSEPSHSTSQQRSTPSNQNIPHRRDSEEVQAKGDSAQLAIPRPSLDEVEAHVGWLKVAEDGRFMLEKGFRAVRTWLTKSDMWQYDYEEVKNSLRITTDSNLKVFWFEDYAREPWVAKDVHAIAGAIERMHRKGEICLFIASKFGHVRALSKEQRMLWTQKDQMMPLDFTLADIAQESTAIPTGPPRREGKYEVPGITVSLQKILVMGGRLRVSYEPAQKHDEQ
ncbi:hypothetical protein Q7P37_002531 [Cladosporium fusiforme]